MSGATDSDEAVHELIPCSSNPITAILKRVHIEDVMEGPLLLCLMTGDGLDCCCEFMPRDPAPPTGQQFDQEFAAHLKAAIAINPAVHDGAVILRRRAISAPYFIVGWSCRLMAPLPKNRKAAPNRGSAYNSCLATSAQAGVDTVYLLSGGQLTAFKDGFENSTTNIGSINRT